MSVAAGPEDLHSIVERLTVILHPERVAVIASVNERQLRDWQSDIAALPHAAETALRLADAAVVALLERPMPLHADTVYGWFGGENELLGRHASALVIRRFAGDPLVQRAVVNAASAFLCE